MFQSRRLGLIFPWLFFSAFVMFVFGWMASGSELALASQLEARGVKGQGTVTSGTNGDGLNSPYLYYKFELDGRTVYGHSHILAKDRGLYGPNSTVNFLYLPEDPTKSGVSLAGMRESGWRGIKIACAIELVVTIFFFAASMSPGRTYQKQTFLGSRTVTQANPLGGLVIIGLMLCFGVSMLLFGVLPDYRKAEDLVNTGMPVTAQITGVYTRSKSHTKYAEYTFELNGQFYHGSSDYQGSYGDRGPIQVWYLPSDPTYSNSNPASKLKNAQTGIVFMIIWNLIIGGIGGGVFLKWKSGRPY